MTLKYIKRRETYKYEIVEDYSIYLPELAMAPDVYTKFASLTNGVLKINNGFMWDGSSGPTIDSKKDMVPSAVHDATCAFVQLGMLPESWVSILNIIYYRLCRERKMYWIQAQWRRVTLQITKWMPWGKKQDEPEILEAP